MAYPQAVAPLSINGVYGVSYTQSSSGSQVDASGRMTADNAADTLAGVVDSNFFLSPSPNTPLTGGFTAVTPVGRADGTFSNQNFFTPTVSVKYYLIDSNRGYFVEQDSLTTGLVMLGYYERKTPVCEGCP